MEKNVSVWFLRTSRKGWVRCGVISPGSYDVACFLLWDFVQDIDEARPLLSYTTRAILPTPTKITRNMPREGAKHVQRMEYGTRLRKLD